MAGTAGTADFFQKQDDARSMTRVLVLCLILVAAGTAVGIFVIARALLTLFGIGSFTEHFLRGEPLLCGSVTASEFYAIFPDTLLFAVIFILVFAWIGGFSLRAYANLDVDSGAKIAAQLGGREVKFWRGDLPEKTAVFVNIVQEMSLAAGVPAPRIFVLSEKGGINAFAAGTGADSAALAVTQGALDKLARDELQALVAHAYSRIVNGDMRLGTKVSACLAGMLSVSSVGLKIFKTGTGNFFDRLLDPKREISKEEETRNGCSCALLIVLFVPMLFVVLFGAGVWAAGFVGLAFAEFVQHRISRERERLADAAAVQFTRNAPALTRALKCVGGNAEGGRISAAFAAQYSHLFFVESGKTLYDEKHALARRILHLEPSWNGKYLRLRRAETDAANGEFSGENTPDEAQSAAAAGTALAHGLLGAAFFADAYYGAANGVPAENGVPASDAQAARFAAFQTVWRCAQSPDDARALIYLLLILGNGNSQSVVTEQGTLVLFAESEEIFRRAKALESEIAALPSSQHISAVLLAVPALRTLSAEERKSFCDNLEVVAGVDGQFSLYETCIIVAVSGFLLGDTDSDREFLDEEIAGDLELILNLFLLLCGLPEENRAALLESVVSARPVLPQNLRVRSDVPAQKFSAIRNAFTRLRRSDPYVRAWAVDTARAIVAADGEITAQEYDLLNSFAFAVDCPIFTERNSGNGGRTEG